MKVGIAGLSHLGLVTGICFASRGFELIGFDADEKLVSDLKQGLLPVYEPQLKELLEQNKDRISFSSDAQSLNKCDVIYVARDVPTDKNNTSNAQEIINITNLVINQAKVGGTIVIHSQVSPSFTRSLLSLRAEDLLSRNIKLYYQVETLIFGSAVSRALHPERYIIGCEDPTQKLPERYKDVLKTFGCPVLQMRYESAELAKIAINMFLVSSVCTTNTLAEICERIGADWIEIESALRLDKRIGEHAYLKPGLGLSGGNLERDLSSIKNLSHTYGTHSEIVDAWLSNSTYRSSWILKTLHNHVFSTIKDPKIALWGLAYKPGTHSVKNSPAIELLRNLSCVPVQVYDPKVKMEGVEFNWVKNAENPLECCKGADVLIIMTPWEEFKEVDLNELAKSMRHKVIIDPYRVFETEKCESLSVRSYNLGV